MLTRNCPKCGKPITPPEVLFCPSCGAALPQSTPPPTYSPVAPAPRINTHSYGWAILAFLVSFLWFKVGNAPVFPLGFIGGLIISRWSWEIDRAAGKQSMIRSAIALSVLGMILGLIIR
jgi:hypothetical protein